MNRQIYSIIKRSKDPRQLQQRKQTRTRSRIIVDNDHEALLLHVSQMGVSTV